MGKGVKSHRLVVTNHAINCWGQKNTVLKELRKMGNSLLEMSNNQSKIFINSSHVCKNSSHKILFPYNSSSQREKVFPGFLLFSTIHLPPARFSQTYSNNSITPRQCLQSPRAQSCHLLWLLFLSISSSSLKTPFPFHSQCPFGWLSSLFPRPMHFPENLLSSSQALLLHPSHVLLPVKPPIAQNWLAHPWFLGDFMNH